MGRRNEEQRALDERNPSLKPAASGAPVCSAERELRSSRNSPWQTTHFTEAQEPREDRGNECILRGSAPVSLEVGGQGEVFAAPLILRSWPSPTKLGLPNEGR